MFLFFHLTKLNLRMDKNLIITLFNMYESVALICEYLGLVCECVIVRHHYFYSHFQFILSALFWHWVSVLSRTQCAVGNKCPIFTKQIEYIARMRCLIFQWLL